MMTASKITLAVLCARRSRRRGLAGAQFQVSLIHELGLGVPKSDLKAFMWCDIAAAGKQAEAIKAGHEVSQQLTKAQISAARKAASKWLVEHRN